ncbi:electron transfer flavoprotein subunit beta/FixA family protein, partial [Psychrosphaera sp.]|nr:electron transfer flavoprotein subunit beta/FixA family protein [Psychrosphaera sp.]
VIPAADLGVELTSKVKVLKVEEPSQRGGGVIVESVAELVEKLKNEAKVIA